MSSPKKEKKRRSVRDRIFKAGPAIGATLGAATALGKGKVKALEAMATGATVGLLPDNYVQAVEAVKDASDKSVIVQAFNDELEKISERGLWDNIHAKRKRIAAGSGERMRRPGSKGAPTARALRESKEKNAELTPRERRKTQRAMKRALNRFARERGVDPKKAMLVAGGAAYLHGFRDDVNDIDFFHPDLTDFVKEQRGRFEMDGGPARDLPEEAKQWQRIGGMRVQTPEAMLAFYKRLDRPKDQEKIKFLSGRLEKKAARKLTPLELDMWPHEMEEYEAKRGRLGRLLTGKESVKRSRHVPVSRERYIAHLNAGGTPRNFHEKKAEIEYRGTTFPGYNKPIPSNRKGKKKMVLVRKGGRVKLVHFGQKGYEDFTQHKDPKRRENYLKRSGGIRGKGGKLTANDPFSANYWARKELW